MDVDFNASDASEDESSSDDDSLENSSEFSTSDPSSDESDDWNSKRSRSKRVSEFRKKTLVNFDFKKRNCP